MADDETNRLLDKIGQLLAEDHEYALERTLLYADVDHGAVGPSIYKELGNQILYRRPDLGRLAHALLDLWEAQDTDDRWAEIAYVVEDGKFDVTYIYPDDIDPDELSGERRERAVRRHLGDQPIVYPPWPPDDDASDYAL